MFYRKKYIVIKENTYKNTLFYGYIYLCKNASIVNQ